MPYKAKDLLHLANVVLNGGTVQDTTADALHLVAYVGDADGNGSYSSNDAVLITRALLSTDSGFTAYPLVDPVIVADTDGSGFIPADAALQANEAGVGFQTANLPIPPIPANVNFQGSSAALLQVHFARTNAAHPVAYVKSSSPAASGESMTAPGQNPHESRTAVQHAALDWWFAQEADLADFNFGFGNGSKRKRGI
jgi:hypothetical protein